MSTRSLALAVFVGLVAVACGGRTDLPMSATQNMPDASTGHEAGSLFGTPAATRGDAMAEAQSAADAADAAACKLPAALQVVSVQQSGVDTAGPTTPCVVELPPVRPCGPREYALRCTGLEFPQPFPAGGGGFANPYGAWVSPSCRPQIPGQSGDGALCCPCE